MLNALVERENLFLYPIFLLFVKFLPIFNSLV
jgi:hypothetical protein